MTNCITNSINTQNPGNPAPAAMNLFNKKENTAKYIEAPKSLPKYSIYKELKKEDEFRKSINAQISENKKKETSWKKMPVIAAAAIIAAFCALKPKK